VETATRPPSRSGPPRPPQPPAPPQRRALAAGHVIVIALVALVVGSLLNADGLRKMAYTQPEGWRRDVGMAATAPMVEISSLLRLDKPREGLKSLLGREEDDRIATTVELPPATSAERPQAAGGPVTDGAATATGAESPGGAGASTGADEPELPRPVFTPDKPMRLWIAGDSLAIVPGQSLLRAVAGMDAVEPISAEVEGRLATGLERPDRYDWFTRIRREMRKSDPDVVVLTFGANDFGGYMTGLPEGVDKTAFGTPTWMKEYRRRVVGVMDLITAEPDRPRLLVWIGVPIVNDEGKNDNYKVVNGMVRAEAERRPGRVAFIDTYRMFRSKDGGFIQQMKNEDGHLEDVRSPDGLHFEPPGGDRVAQVVLRRIEGAVELRSQSPQPDPPPATP
jgi:hypothetical protein